MAATFNLSQSNGAGESKTDLGTGGNLFNFKDEDSSGVQNYDTKPVVAGQNAYEVYLQGHFTGAFNKVDNLQFWRSTDFSPNTGLTVKWDGEVGTGSYAEPVKTTSTAATGAIPTSDPGTANVSIAGSLGGSLAAAGYSDYIALQLQTTTDAAAGDSSLMEATIQYDES